MAETTLASSSAVAGCCERRSFQLSNTHFLSFVSSAKLNSFGDIVGAAAFSLRCLAQEARLTLSAAS